MQLVSTKVSRYGMITGLKPEKANYYKESHTEVWPEVLEKIKQCNIQNYSIFLQEIEGKFYLFSYMEYTGSNFETDMKKMSEHPVTQQWWKEMNPCQLPLPGALEEGSVWKNMEEIFHQD